MGKTHEHLEHAEHAAHAAHDPFDRRVAVTMAVIAACLAGVSTLGHRKHNDVLRVVGEANRYRTEAAAADVEKSNLYAWYQAKKNRTLQYETAVVLAAAVPADKLDPAAAKVVAGWKKKLDEAKHPPTPDDDIEGIMVKAKAKEKEAETMLRAADAQKDEIVHEHHRADRLDVAHLLAEVGLVVCSLSLLTKRKSFWRFGIAATVAALGVAASTYFMEPHSAHVPPTALAPAAPGHAAGH